MKCKLIVLAAAALFLTGCVAPPIPITSPSVTVTPTDIDNAVGLDVYAKQRESNADLPKFRGTTSIEVRAYEAVPDRQRKEVAGVSCQIDGAGQYFAEIITPQVVNVPNYGVHSAVVRASCKTDTLIGHGNAEAYNVRTAQIQQASASAGILGLLAGAAFAAATSDEEDPYLYRPLLVNLTPESE